MTEDEDRRALERYVAGLPADPEALAHAVTARALERAVVVEALLEGLRSEDAGRRLRTAHRLLRMRDLDPALSARLGVLVDQDADARVRAQSAEALRAHGLPVPGERDVPAYARTPVPRFALGLRLLRVMDAAAPVVFEAWFGDDAPELSGELHADGPDATRVELRGLPAGLVDTRPVLRAAREPGTLVEIARADTPVTADGILSLRVDAPRDDVERWCRAGAELIVLDDDPG